MEMLRKDSQRPAAKSGSLTPNDLHHLVLKKRDWSPDLEALLRSYAQWDQDDFDFFDEFLCEVEGEGRLAWTWRLLEDMGIGIRPVGFEFYVQDQKEEEVRSWHHRCPKDLDGHPSLSRLVDSEKHPQRSTDSPLSHSLPRVNGRPPLIDHAWLLDTDREGGV